MNFEKLDIEHDNQSSKEIEDFESREWAISDMEHYGRSDIDLTKKKHKFIARNNCGEIVGMLELIIEVNLAFIEGLLVSSEHRKKGIGKKLIQTAENFSKEKGCTKIFLETNEGWGAENFYKKVGYDITGVHKKHILDQNTLIFTKFF